MAHDKTILELEQVASRLRRHVLSIAAAQRSHLGGSMSAADLMSALFFRFLRFEDDVHVFHACMVELEQIAASELPRSGMSGSRLGGHPTHRAPGVEFATGSLGHALSVGVGIAIAEQLDQSGKRTVVLLGDGEMQEGSAWEAAMTAPRFGLENLVAIVDSNKFQASGDVSLIMPIEPLAEKWRAFNWNVSEIDGHSMPEVIAALDAVPAASGPTAIVANTIKGKGVPGVEGTRRAHYVKLSEQENEAALKALGSAQ